MKVTSNTFEGPLFSLEFFRGTLQGAVDLGVILNSGT